MKAIVLLFFYCLTYGTGNKITDESVAQKFLDSCEQEITELSNKVAIAGYEFATNITDENQAKQLKIQEKFLELDKKLWLEAVKFDYPNFKNEGIRRRIRKLAILGVAALGPEEAKTFMEIQAKMMRIYGSAKACVAGKCDLELEPHLTQLMADTRDWDKLAETWTAWRDSAGRPVRELYKKYVEIAHKCAQVNGFPTFDVFALDGWETPDFKKQVADLMEELRPMYEILHTYVRMKLKQKYGNRMPTDGTIPAHLLGNMWAQQWGRIIDLVVPFPNKKTLDITENLRKQNYTALKFFKMAEQFFVDIGLKPMTEEFWKNSMLTKPTDRSVVCHASAFDFSDKKDFRVKMCTDITMSDFITVHHEMGHIEYYMLYCDQPSLFREGANPGFHEAVGDTISLSVGTPAHLHKVGLFSEAETDFETTINYQMSKALEKIAVLPFSYIVDFWRWDVYSGKVKEDEWNKRWWELRLKYQGISPPCKRSEVDFDPGAKYHIPSNVEYIRYFVSFIVQFQFHKSLCSIAQPNVPLHMCDIDKSKAAGEKLAAGLKLGSSKVWPEALEVLTGSKKMSAQPIIEYFEPLIKYLKTQIANEKIGWTSDVNQYFETKKTNHQPIINVVVKPKTT